MSAILLKRKDLTNKIAIFLSMFFTNFSLQNKAKILPKCTIEIFQDK